MNLLILLGLSSHPPFYTDRFGATNDIILRSDGKKLRQTRLIMIYVSVLVVILCLTLPSNIFWITYSLAQCLHHLGGRGIYEHMEQSITVGTWGMVSGFFSNILASLLDYLFANNFTCLFGSNLNRNSCKSIHNYSCSRRGNSTREVSSFLKGPLILMKLIRRAAYNTYGQKLWSRLEYLSFALFSTRIPYHRLWSKQLLPLENLF